MSIETAKSAVSMAVDHLKQESPGASLGVIFFGGEPLLMRDLIVNTIRHCRQIEADTGQLFHYKVTTNGILLDEPFLTDPETSEIFVALSHDGMQSNHDANRVDSLGRGSFEALEPKIDMLLRHKPYAPVMKVVTPGTIGQYADSVEYLFDKGFRYLICSLDYGAEWQESDMAELERQYELLADWYYEKTLAEEKFYFSPFEVKISSHVHPGSCKAERCELGRTQISVAPNGKLFPCVQFVGDGTDDSWAIGDVWTGIDEDARWRLYDLNAEEKESCLACAIRSRCNHYCGCLNKQATGRIDLVSPMLCAHERTVLPVADRLAARLYKRKDPMFIQKHYNEMFPLVSLVEDASVKR